MTEPFPRKTVECIIGGNQIAAILENDYSNISVLHVIPEWNKKRWYEISYKRRQIFFFSIFFMSAQFLACSYTYSISFVYLVVLVIQWMVIAYSATPPVIRYLYHSIVGMIPMTTPQNSALLTTCFSFTESVCKQHRNKEALNKLLSIACAHLFEHSKWLLCLKSIFGIAKLSQIALSITDSNFCLVAIFRSFKSFVQHRIVWKNRAKKCQLFGELLFGLCCS